MTSLIETLLNDFIGQLEDVNQTVFDAVTGSDVPAIRSDELRAKVPELAAALGQAFYDRAELELDTMPYSIPSDTDNPIEYVNQQIRLAVKKAALSPKPDTGEGA